MLVAMCRSQLMKLLYAADPVSTWMGVHLWVGKPSQCARAIEVDLTFCTPWEGKMTISFQAD